MANTLSFSGVELASYMTARIIADRLLVDPHSSKFVLQVIDRITRPRPEGDGWRAAVAFLLRADAPPRQVYLTELAKCVLYHSRDAGGIATVGGGHNFKFTAREADMLEAAVQASTESLVIEAVREAQAYRLADRDT